MYTTIHKLLYAYIITGKLYKELITEIAFGKGATFHPTLMYHLEFLKYIHGFCECLKMCGVYLIIFFIEMS